jgi:hypothetical protein
MAEEQRQSFVSVWIDGASMDDFDDRVQRLEVTERAMDASSFRMVMSMAPSDQGTWDLMDDERFELMRRITIAFGLGPYRSTEPETLTVVFDGYITSVEPYFGPHRVPDSTLEVAGLDASCLMHFEARPREWKGQSDADIVRTIYQSYGFATDVPDTAPTRHGHTASLLQRTTDAEFVRMLARRNGFECYVEPDDSEVEAKNHPDAHVIGHFHPPRLELDPQPALTLMPRTHPSLIELRARWDSHRPTTIVSRHIDPRSRRIQTAIQDKPRLKQLGKHTRHDLLREKLAPLTRKATLNPIGLQHSHVPHHETELRSLAWADYLDSNWLAEATGKVQGLRYEQIIRARRPVDIQGCGELMDGPWYVRSACHMWKQNEPTQSYEIDIELVRNALGPVAAGGAV